MRNMKKENNASRGAQIVKYKANNVRKVLRGGKKHDCGETFIAYRGDAKAVFTRAS